MQNKSFLYRVVPRRMRVEQRLLQPSKKPAIYGQGVKAVNFFQNCYIFSQPTLYSRSQAIKSKLGSTNSVSKSFEQNQSSFTLNKMELNTSKSGVEANKINKVTQLLQNFSCSLDTIHSKRKNRSFSAHFNEKRKVDLAPQKKLEISAFSNEKCAKKMSFSSRINQSCRTQRKKPVSRIQKILQAYPQNHALCDIPALKSKEMAGKCGYQMKNKLYRPWSPDKLMSTTIQIGEDLQIFFATPQ